MTGIGVPQIARHAGIEHAVEAGDEHVLGDIGTEVVVDAREHGAGLVQALGARAQHASRRSHHHRCRDPLVGHVADDEPDTPVGQLDEVVEVTAHGPGRPVERCDLPPRELGQMLRQEVLLNQLRDLQLLLEPAARPDLDLLLADELADANGRRSLCAKGLEQAPVVGRGSPDRRGAARR